jgi:hypothetical protein
MYRAPFALWAAVVVACSTTSPAHGTPAKPDSSIDSTLVDGSTALASDAGYLPGAASPAATRSFEQRCAGSGVLVCEGFDDPNRLKAVAWPNSGAYPSSGDHLNVFYDARTKASGAGAIRFFIPANMTDDASGSWLQHFGKAFGAGSSFYVQYRFRMDKAMATTDWEDVKNGGSSPKIAIFHNAQATCASEEITVNNRYASGKPTMYTDCGARGFYVLPGTTQYAADPPLQYQNGWYNCEYPDVSRPPGGCFKMPADQWLTFYVRVSIGDWEQPNSKVVGYVGLAGEPLHAFVDVENMILHQDGDNEYDTLTLLNYMTGFGQQQPARNPEANTWYDELIVSSEPIPAPDGASP